LGLARALLTHHGRSNAVDRKSRRRSVRLAFDLGPAVKASAFLAVLDARVVFFTRKPGDLESDGRL
jgi:hypothetical protein